MLNFRRSLHGEVKKESGDLQWGKWELSELPLEAALEDLNKRLL